MNQDWESELGVLYIQWKLPIDQFLNGGSSKENVLRKMDERILLSQTLEEKINNLYTELNEGSLMPLVSIRTPIAGSFDRKFDLIFNRENYEETEVVDVLIKYGIFWTDFFLSEFPKGHHCVLFATIQKESNLINNLPFEDNPGRNIGICDKINWMIIKEKLIQSDIDYAND